MAMKVRDGVRVRVRLRTGNKHENPQPFRADRLNQGKNSGDSGSL